MISDQPVNNSIWSFLGPEFDSRNKKMKTKKYKKKNKKKNKCLYKYCSMIEREPEEIQGEKQYYIIVAVK